MIEARNKFGLAGHPESLITHILAEKEPFYSSDGENEQVEEDFDERWDLLSNFYTKNGFIGGKELFVWLPLHYCFAGTLHKV